MSKRTKKFKSSLKEVAGFVAGGGALGVGVAAHVGKMGLAVGGGAIGIGMAPVAAAGIVTGLAAYGLKHASKDLKSEGDSKDLKLKRAFKSLKKRFKD